MIIPILKYVPLRLIEVKELSNYRKHSIGSLTFIILDPKIPRLVSEVLYNVQLPGQKVFNKVTEGPMRAPKSQKSMFLMIYKGDNILRCPTSNRIDLY